MGSSVFSPYVFSLLAPTVSIPFFTLLLTTIGFYYTNLQLIITIFLSNLSKTEKDEKRAHRPDKLLYHLKRCLTSHFVGFFLEIIVHDDIFPLTR